MRLTMDHCKNQRHATAPGMAGYRQVTDLLDTIDALESERAERERQVREASRQDELLHIAKILQNRGPVWLADWLRTELAALRKGDAPDKQSELGPCGKHPKHFNTFDGLLSGPNGLHRCIICANAPAVPAPTAEKPEGR